MKTVSKGILKSKMLEYFREVERTGEELIVTDNHIPVIKVVPIKKKWAVSEVFADLQGKLKGSEYLNEPTESEWTDT